MAHLVVTNETVVIDQQQQENIGRGSGKHKRVGHDDVELTCHEGSLWPGSDATKRRALAPITNQVLATTNRQFGGSGIMKPATCLKPDLSFCSSLVIIIIWLCCFILFASYPAFSHTIKSRCSSWQLLPNLWGGRNKTNWQWDEFHQKRIKNVGGTVV